MYTGWDIPEMSHFNYFYSLLIKEKKKALQMFLPIDLGWME